jgi:hypothetical protein
VIDEIICIGTSYTWGDGIDVKRNKDIIKWYKENTNQIISRETHAFPALLQTLTNIKTRNLGKCGTSIEYVCRNVEELLESEDLSNKLLILEYANWGRSELWSNKYQQFIVANWGPEDGKDVINGYATYLTLDYGKMYDDSTENTWELREEIELYNKFCDSFMDENRELIFKDRLFLNLLYKLNQKNIKFLVIPLNHFYWKELDKDLVLKKNLCKFVFGKNDYALGGFMSHHKLRIHDDIGGDCIESHPSPSGHKKIAEQIYEYLQKNDQL